MDPGPTIALEKDLGRCNSPSLSVDYLLSKVVLTFAMMRLGQAAFQPASYFLQTATVSQEADLGPCFLQRPSLWKASPTTLSSRITLPI